MPATNQPNCEACGHQHSGRQWAYICIGCPCPETPGAEEEPSEDRRHPVAMMRSDEAMFETYHTDSGGVMLVMRPHGVEKGTDREVGWDLTWAEVEGLRTLLAETMPDDEDEFELDDDEAGDR